MFEAFSVWTYFYLEAKVLHPLLDGGWDCSFRFVQGLRPLLTASQQTRITGNVDSSSCNGHLGCQSRIQGTENNTQLNQIITKHSAHAITYKPSIHDAAVTVITVQ